MKCAICGEIDIDKFYKNEKYRCKECSKEKRRDYYKRNKEKEKEKAKQYRMEKKDYYSNYNKKYRKENREYFIQYGKKHYDKNVAIEKYNEWKKNNREQYLKTKRRLSKKYYRTVNGKISRYMSTAIWFCLKKNKNRRKWQEIVGYTKEQLLKRLLETLPEGFTFNDYVNGKLHVDHIIPKVVYNMSKEEEFKKCWSLRNLRLLSEKENLKKNKKLDMVLIEEYKIHDLLPNEKVKEF